MLSSDDEHVPKGWTVNPLREQPYLLLTEEEFYDEFLTDNLLETMLHYNKSTEQALKTRGLVMNMFNIFCYLLPLETIAKISDYTS